MQHRRNKDHQKEDGRPPIFGAWWRFYTAVILWLVLLIIFFYLFTGYFS
ncbi:MAG TPA: hypothetical protein VFX43_18940 [Chitinophagaceae bacterium]|jgi:hypothetical protein|nr:hypothetical protein [Chitinophagaceae bacterium]